MLLASVSCKSLERSMLKLQFLKHTGDSVMLFLSTKMFKNSLSVKSVLSVLELQVKE